MPFPPITTLPTVPSRSDAPTTFSNAMDAFLSALPTFQQDVNAFGTHLDGVTSGVETAAADATAAAAAAAAASGAAKWVSGTTYAEGDVTWSPTSYLIYRRKTNGAGTTDPASDSTNWAVAAGSGDVTLNGSQTLTNKTLTAPVIAGTILEDIYTISDGGSVDLDPANGSIQLWTLGGNRTPTASNFVNGQSMLLMIADGAAYAVTWSSLPVTWINTVTPTLPTSGYAVIILWKVGGTIYGAFAGSL